MRGRGACEPERPRKFCCGRMRAKYEKGSVRKVLGMEGLCVCEGGAGLIGAERGRGGPGLLAVEA